jgi:hypothetical protein
VPRIFPASVSCLWTFSSGRFHWVLTRLGVVVGNNHIQVVIFQQPLFLPLAFPTNRQGFLDHCLRGKPALFLNRKSVSNRSGLSMDQGRTGAFLSRFSVGRYGYSRFSWSMMVGDGFDFNTGDHHDLGIPNS